MAKPTQLTGTIVAYNLSPHGDHEGVLLETEDGVVQVNFPKHGEGINAVVGAQVELSVERHDKKGKHKVFELVEHDGPVTGKVVRFNHSRHGEVNGYQLDSGEMIHVKPDGAKRSKVAIGDTITAEGEYRRGDHGTVIEASRVKKAKAAD